MEKLNSKIQSLREQFNQAKAQVKDQKSLQELRNLFLSRKKGLLTQLFVLMKALAPEERPAAGQGINAFKHFVQQSLDELAEKFQSSSASTR